jgi:hypothetical protein
LELTSKRSPDSAWLRSITSNWLRGALLLALCRACRNLSSGKGGYAREHGAARNILTFVNFGATQKKPATGSLMLSKLAHTVALDHLHVLERLRKRLARANFSKM